MAAEDAQGTPANEETQQDGSQEYEPPHIEEISDGSLPVAAVAGVVYNGN